MLLLCTFESFQSEMIVHKGAVAHSEEKSVFICGMKTVRSPHKMKGS